MGLGLEFAAHSYGLDFLPLTQENYDLVIPDANLALLPIQALVEWLQHERGRKVISNLPGYDTACTGQVVWVK